jgi:hypothetical protein
VAAASVAVALFLGFREVAVAVLVVTQTWAQEPQGQQIKVTLAAGLLVQLFQALAVAVVLVLLEFREEAVVL